MQPIAPQENTDTDNAEATEEKFRVLDAKLALILLFICTMILVIVFPNRNRLGNIFRDAEPTLNTVQYLSQWVAENPDDAMARLALARKHLENFAPQAAHDVLEPMIAARPQETAALPDYWNGLMLLHRALAQAKAADVKPQFPHYGLTTENAADASMPIALRLALAEQSVSLSNTALTKLLLLPQFFEDSTLSAMQVIHAMNLLYDISQHAQGTALGLKAFAANQNSTLWHKILKTLINANQINQATAFYLTTPAHIQESGLYRKNLITYKMRLAPDTITAQDVQQWLNTKPSLKAIKSALTRTLAHTKLPASETLARAWYQQEPQNPQIQKRLHDILRWQGKITEALLISEQRLATHPSSSLFNIALEEAWALSDYQALGRLYQQAIFNNWLAPVEVPRAVVVLDRALPEEKVTNALAALFENHPNSHLVREHYLQRLADQHDHTAAARVWRTLPTPNLRISLPLRKRLARLAYQQNASADALDYLVRGIQWADVTDPDYLDTATQVAQTLGTAQTSERLAYQHFKLTGKTFDYYLEIRQAHAQDEKRIGQALLAHYQKHKDEDLLALATQHARDTQDDALILSLLETLEADPNHTPLPSLLIYAAGVYQSQGNLDKAQAALAKAFLNKPEEPELQYQQFAQTLALNHAPQVTQIFDLYNESPNTVPEPLWGLMAEAADRLERLTDAIQWYTRVAQNNPQETWPIYRLAVLLARAGEIDRSHYLKKHLLNTMGSPNIKQLSDIDLLVLDEFLGQQFSTPYIQQQLLSKHGQAVNLQIAQNQTQKRNAPLMLAYNTTLPTTLIASTTPTLSNPTDAKQQQQQSNHASTAYVKPSHETQQLYQQLITRLLENYQYYAVNQWQTLEENTSLALAPWQALALAQSQNNPQAVAILATNEAPDNQTGLSAGAYYEALLLAGKNQQAWRYGQSKLKESETDNPDKTQTRIAYRAQSDITDYNYLRELHLSQLSQKAHKWSAHYRFLTDRASSTDEQTVALNYQAPSQWGAWQFDALFGQAPKNDDLAFQNTNRRTRFLSAGHRWIGRDLSVQAQATLSHTNRENFLGFKLAASGEKKFRFGQSNWQIHAGWRQPFTYNNQIDFLTRSNSLGASLATAHHSFLQSFISFRQDQIETTQGDKLGTGYRLYAELSADLFRTDRLLEPYIAWYQQDFDLEGGPNTPLPSLSAALGQPVALSGLFLSDYQQAMAGVRLGIQNDVLLSRPFEHILDIGVGYEPLSDRGGYTISDQWLLRVGSLQFMRFKLGLSELTPNGSRQAWFEFGFEQLME